ncbi:MAG: cytochrome c, partial [Rhodospirillales bacterium]|nr:cytochrome c [Rhodospirillales bacterium]
DGKVIYEEFCGYCHGFALDGKSSWFAPTAKDAVESPRLDEKGNTWKLSDRSLFEITKHGGQSVAAPGVESKMPAFDKVISDQQIEAAIGYIKSVWPDDVHRWRDRNGKNSG